MEILSATEEGIRFLGFVGAFDTTEVEAFQAHIDLAEPAGVGRIE